MRTFLHPLPLALAMASVALPVFAAESSATPDSEQAEAPVELRPQYVEAVREEGDGPVSGYVASRSRTATKTDTPLLETPQSISVVSAARIRDQGSLTVQDSLRYVAGVRGETFGLDSRGDSAQIRGSTPQQMLDGLQQSFGYYNNTRVDPFTLERIEVLRGPSSMLYGQSPVGGLVNMVSKRPREEQRTELQLQYGSFDRKQIAVDSTGPLNDERSLLYRVIAIQRDSDTQVDHVKDNRLLLMPSLTWRPNQDFEWTVLANLQKDDSGTNSGFLPHTGTVLPAPYGRFDSKLFVSEPGFDEYDSEQVALSSLASWRVTDDWTLRQNLRWQRSEVSYQTIYGWPWVLAPDNRSINRVYYVSKPEIDSWVADHNLEGRFETGALRHQLLVGVDYQRSHLQSRQASGLATPLDLYTPVYGSFDPSQIQLIDQPDQDTRQEGLYVQDQIRLGNWLATIGLRKDWASNRVQGQKAQKDDAVTGRYALSYLFDNGVTPYLSYSESFQPSIGINQASGQAFKPLEGEQWELGVKYQPLGGDSLYTAAIFDLREKNRQMSDPINPFNTLQNGETRARGLELEALVAINADWDLIANYTRLDTETLKGEATQEGRRLESVPEQMASLWSTYRFSLAGIPGFKVGAGVRYVGASWDGIDQLKTPSTTLYDAMLGYEQDEWGASLTATNLADETYYTTCLNRGDCFTGNRRTLVGTLSYRF